jgi:hypothetical protein
MDDIKSVLKRIRISLHCEQVKSHQNDNKKIRILKKDVAKALGMQANALNGHVTNGTIPHNNIMNFCKVNSLDLNWIFWGKIYEHVTKKTIEVANEAAQNSIKYDAMYSYFVTSLATFKVFTKEEYEKNIYQNKFIQYLNLINDNSIIFTMQDSSMQNMIFKNDRVIVNTLTEELEEEKFYLIELFNGEQTIRRYIDGSFKADKPDYPTYKSNTKIVGVVEAIFTLY